MVNSGIKILLVNLFLLLAYLLPAQSVRVKATSNKDRILIGEPILLQLEAESETVAGLGWFNLDSIPHFEIIEAGKQDTLAGSMGKIISQSLTITSFDSGSQVIPQMAITLNNSRFLTDSIKIEVGYSTTDTNQPYHDIRDIIEVPLVEPLYVNYIIAVLTILAIVALVLLLRQKKPLPEAEVEQKGPRLSPFEKAMVALTNLKAGKFLESGQYKTYYIQLNEVLRDYCRAENLGAKPDSSNSNLVVDLKPLLLNDDLFSLAQALRLADAVKFARYQPTPEEQLQVHEVIRTSIEKINQQVHKKSST
jgi:hypothetical protein